MIFRFTFTIAIIAGPWYAEDRINQLLPQGFYPALMIYYLIGIGAIVEGWNRGR